MSITGEKNSGRDGGERSRRTIFVIAGLVALLLLGGLIGFLNREMIKLDEPIADYADSVAGDIQMNMATTVRNFTGRTISGLEMRGAVLDFQGKPIKERTKIVLPSGALAELENNGTARAPIAIPGFRGDDKARVESGLAVIKMEVTAIKFK
jgi:hypothetical protein